MTSLGWFDRFFRSVEGWRERVKQIHQRNDDGQPADYCYHTGTSNGVERHHRHTFSSSFLRLSMETPHVKRLWLLNLIEKLIKNVRNHAEHFVV